ncbi:MAG: hypothetical protein KAI66_25270, partial [Lentisphaeria bacterium]|nr:hypothetical protein [Lentisphaeria bacterium]
MTPAHHTASTWFGIFSRLARQRIRRPCRVLLTLLCMACALSAAPPSLQVMPDRSLYTHEKKGRILLVGDIPLLERRNTRVEIRCGGKRLGGGRIDRRFRVPTVPFETTDLQNNAVSILSVTLTATGIQTVTAKTQVLRFDPKPNEVKIDHLGGGLIVNDLPFFPFGFYCYSPVQPTLAEEEVVRGFNMMSPYQSNSATSRNARLTYMNRCASLGMRVNFQLLRVAGGGGVYGATGGAAQLTALREEVRAFRDHPALLAWYTADEPTGRGTDPKLLESIRNAIRQEDPHHPVSVVFMRARRATEYAQGLDIVMVDPYPIPSRPPTDAGDAVRTAFQALSPAKAIWLVPQCFGGNEHWQREPTPAEARVMTYLGIVEGARGIQYFVRQGLRSFPKSPALWHACADMAMEVAELTPHLLSTEPQPAVTVSPTQVRAAAWRYKNTVVIIAVNTRNQPAAMRISLTGFEPEPDIRLPFENRKVTVTRQERKTQEKKGFWRNLFAQDPLLNPRPTTPPRQAVFEDMIDAFGVRVYRLTIPGMTHRGTTQTPGNMIVNPGFENNPSVGVPAGCYTTGSRDRGATCTVDSRVALEGTHSLRLHTPHADAGIRVKPFRPRIEPGAAYSFSFWAKCAAGQPPQTLGVGIAGEPKQTFILNSQWRRHSVSAVAPTKSRNSKMPLWYTLESAGTAWIDELEFHSLAPRASTGVDPGTGRFSVALDIPPQAVVRWSIDEPVTKTSTRYGAPIPFEHCCQLNLRVEKDERAFDQNPVTLLRHAANGRRPTYLLPYAEKYPGSGDGTLTDGLVAGTNHK